MLPHIVCLSLRRIWDVLTNDQAVNIVANATAKKQDAAKTLVTAAFQAGSTDNMTAVVVRLARTSSSAPKMGAPLFAGA